MVKEGRSVVAGGRGTRTFLEMMDMFIIWIVVKVSQMYTYIKTSQTVHFKHVCFIVCQLYLNKAVKMLKKTTWLNNEHINREY